MKLTFGKYKGAEINEAPRDYLGWVLKQVWCKGNLKAEIEAVLSGAPVAYPLQQFVPTRHFNTYDTKQITEILDEWSNTATSTKLADDAVIMRVYNSLRMAFRLVE